MLSVHDLQPQPLDGIEGSYGRTHSGSPGGATSWRASKGTIRGQSGPAHLPAPLVYLTSKWRPGNGGGRGIRTPKGLAARWISSPLPCQLRLALRAHSLAY